MARISKPYEVISEKKEEKPVTKLSEAQEVILKYMQGLEPTKPVKWVRPIVESFKPIEEQKDTSLARLALFLNPQLRLHVNESLARKTGKYTDVIEMLKKDWVLKKVEELVIRMVIWFSLTQCKQQCPWTKELKNHLKYKT